MREGSAAAGRFMLMHAKPAGETAGVGEDRYDEMLVQARPPTGEDRAVPHRTKGFPVVRKRYRIAGEARHPTVADEVQHIDAGPFTVGQPAARRGQDGKLGVERCVAGLRRRLGGEDPRFP